MMPRISVIFTSVDGAPAPISSSVPTVPGPTVYGIASGTTAISPSSFDWRPAGIPVPRTTSIPLSSSTMPEPMRNASSVMPRYRKIASPNR